jgi:hypothetical protein
LKKQYGSLIFTLIYSAVFCPEKEVPSFKAGTGMGTTNLAELKAADPVKWNSWRKRYKPNGPIHSVQLSFPYK